MLQFDLSPTRPAPSPVARNVVVEYDDALAGATQTVYAHPHRNQRTGNGSSGSSPSEVEASPAGGSYTWNTDSSIKKARLSPQSVSDSSRTYHTMGHQMRDNNNNNSADGDSLMYSDAAPNLEVVDPYEELASSSPQTLYGEQPTEEEEDSPMARIPPNNMFQRDPARDGGDATQRNAFLEELLLHVDDEEGMEGTAATVLPKSPSPERQMANAPSQLWSDTSSATSRSTSVSSVPPPPPPFNARGAPDKINENVRDGSTVATPTVISPTTVLSESYRQAQDELHEAFLHVGSRIAKLRESSPSPHRPRSTSASPPPTTTPVHIDHGNSMNSSHSSNPSSLQIMGNRSTSAALSHTSPQSAPRSQLSVSPGEGSRLMRPAPSQQPQTPMWSKPPRAPTSTPHGPGLLVHEVTVHMDSEDEQQPHSTAPLSTAGKVGNVVWASESEEEEEDEPQPRDPMKDASTITGSASRASVYEEYFGRESSPPPAAAQRTLSPPPPPPADRVERVLPFSRRSISPDRDEPRPAAARAVSFSPSARSPSPPENALGGGGNWRERGHSPPVAYAATQGLLSRPRREASPTPSPTAAAITVPQRNTADRQAGVRKASSKGKGSALMQRMQKGKKSYSPPSVSLSPMSDEEEDLHTSSSGPYAYSSNHHSYHESTYNASHDDTSFYNTSPPPLQQQQRPQQPLRERRSASRESAVERSDAEVQLYLRGSLSRSPAPSAEASRSPSPCVPRIESVRGAHFARPSSPHVVSPTTPAAMNEALHNNSNSSHAPFISLTPYLSHHKDKAEPESGSIRLVCAVEVEMAPGSTAFLQVYRHDTVEDAVLRFVAEHHLDRDTVFAPLVAFVASQVRLADENASHNTSGMSSSFKSEGGLRERRPNMQTQTQQSSKSLHSRAGRPPQEGVSFQRNNVSTAMAYLEALLSGKETAALPLPPPQQRRLRSVSSSPDVAPPPPASARSLSLSPPPPVSILVDRMRSSTREPERSVETPQPQPRASDTAPEGLPYRGRSRSAEMDFARETNSSRLRRRSAEQKRDELLFKKEEEAAQEFGPAPARAATSIAPAPKVDNGVAHPSLRRLLPKKERADVAPRRTKIATEVSTASTRKALHPAATEGAKRKPQRSPSTGARRTGSAPVMTSRDTTALYTVQPTQTRSSLLRQQHAASSRLEQQLQEEKLAMGLPATTTYHPVKKDTSGMASMNSSGSGTSSGPGVSRRVLLLPRRNSNGSVNSSSVNASREEPQPLWKQSLLWSNHHSNNNNNTNSSSSSSSNSVMASTLSDSSKLRPSKRQDQEQRLKELYTLHQSFLQEQSAPQSMDSRPARSPNATEPRRAHSAAAAVEGGASASRERRVRFVDPVGGTSPSEEGKSPRAPYTDISTNYNYKTEYTLKSKKGQFLQALNENILFNNAVQDASVGLKAPLLSPPSNRGDAGLIREAPTLLRPFSSR